MLGSFLIFAREGIEGTLICAILMTFLAAAGRRDLFRAVLAGAGAAVLVAVGVGVILWVVSRDAFVGSNQQAWFETAVFLVAVVVLTYMTFWMRRHARTMSREIRDRAAGAVAGGSAMALALIAFVTVGREAVETVLFLLAIAYQSSPLQVGIGAVLGLGLALIVAFAMYRVGVRVNIGKFFSVLGSLLLLVAAGLMANAVGNLQELGALPGGSMKLWDMSGALADDRGVGDVLHGLLGYSASPTVLQLLVWLGFLAAGLWLFLRPAPKPAAPRPVPSPS
ncbi:MAG: FTR1 family iron permease [Candidatus Dormibacteria bacterium]